jgi:hypothetical protein
MSRSWWLRIFGGEPERKPESAPTRLPVVTPQEPRSESVAVEAYSPACRACGSTDPANVFYRPPLSPASWVGVSEGHPDEFRLHYVARTAWRPAFLTVRCGCGFQQDTRLAADPDRDKPGTLYHPDDPAKPGSGETS